MIVLIARALSILCWSTVSSAVYFLFFQLSLIIGLLVVLCSILFIYSFVLFLVKEKKVLSSQKKFAKAKFDILSHLN